MKLAEEEKTVSLLAVVHTGKAHLVFNAHAALELPIGKAMSCAAPHVGGRGGGKGSSARGAGPDPAGVEKALTAAREALGIS